VRLFVAADAGPGITGAAQAVVAELRARVEQQAPSARVTWIPAPLMHLTIRFIGDVPDDRIDAVTRVLAEPLAVAPFTLEVTGIGAFSSHGAPRVLWARLAQGAAELRRVERLVTGRLQSVGIPPDEREFTPHLTLGRVRDGRGLRTLALVAGYETRALGTATVDAITLFQSRLSPNGPTYVALHRTPLTAG
jgi:2'-5' RNA ligase